MCVYGGGSILLSMSFQVKSILNSSLAKGRGKRQNTSWEKVGQVRKYRNRLTKLQNSHATNPQPQLFGVSYGKSQTVYVRHQQYVLVVVQLISKHARHQQYDEQLNKFLSFSINYSSNIKKCQIYYARQHWKIRTFTHKLDRCKDILRKPYRNVTC